MIGKAKKTKLPISDFALSETLIAVAEAFVKIYLWASISLFVLSAIKLALGNFSLVQLETNFWYWVGTIVTGFSPTPLTLLFIKWQYTKHLEKLQDEVKLEEKSHLPMSIKVALWPSIIESKQFIFGHLILLFALVNLTSSQWSFLAFLLNVLWCNFVSALVWRSTKQKIYLEMKEQNMIHEDVIRDNFRIVIIGVVQKSKSKGRDTATWKGGGGGFSGGGASGEF
jgi:hypothetical protein